MGRAAKGGSILNMSENQLITLYGYKFPETVKFKLENNESVVFSDVKLEVDVDLALQAMQQMWGNFPELNGHGGLPVSQDGCRLPQRGGPRCGHWCRSR